MLPYRSFLSLFALLALTATSFLLLLFTGKQFGINEAAAATICSAASLFVSATIALLGFQLNRRTQQEAWSVIFRELHRDFWDDKTIEKVRRWLCSDEAYANELLPVLRNRESGTASAAEYPTIEALDHYCALMLRLVTVNQKQFSPEQEQVFKTLGYDWWLYKLHQKEEVRDYIHRHWTFLASKVPTESPRPLDPSTPLLPPSASFPHSSAPS